jgi:peptidoglycan biosynthesis protein MviN/MurJ (putative lipid II flippase)
MANSLSNIYSGEIANFYKSNNLEEGLKKLKDSSTKLMRWLFPLTIILLFVSKYFFKLAIGNLNDLLQGGLK